MEQYNWIGMKYETEKDKTIVRSKKANFSLVWRQ